MELRRKLNLEGAKAAGPLLHGWARRSLHGKASTGRQLEALVRYLPTAPLMAYNALGGQHALDWAQKALDQHVETPVKTDSGIQVLGLPYGGPNGGKDNEGQFFSPNTDFLDGIIDTPPVMYVHGTQNGFEPEPVGKVNGRWYDRRGGWFNVELDPLGPRYSQLMDAHATGNLRASSGAVPASYSADPATGHIDTWLVGELSLVDLRDGYRPVNAYAITKAAPDVQFLDYYGDPVEEKPLTLLQQIKQKFDEMMLLLAREEITEPDDTVDPYFRAEEFGGKKRSDLPAGDFVFGDERKFPVVDQEDLNSAVRLWGQYQGDHSRDDFEAGIRRLAKKHDLSLPESWQTKAEEIMPETEKCEQCEEAARLAETLRAELAVEPVVEVVKCARCPEAVNWIRSMVKAGKMPATEAFSHLEVFVQSDATFDAVKAEVEGRATIAIPVKAQVLIAGGQPSVGVDTIDQEHMNKQRRLAGLPVK